MGGDNCDGQECHCPGMKADEPIVVLILAANWQDEVNVGASDGTESFTTLNTRSTVTRTWWQKNGSSSVSLSKFREILPKTRRRGLVDIGEYDARYRGSDVEVAIRPMIKLDQRRDALLRLESYVR